jgi:TonB-linked SusC/RagA family outer membrane protein
MKFRIYFKGILTILVLCFCLFALNAEAQTRMKIQGVVKSDKGELLPGVAVTIKDTNTGVVTNANGEYTITVEKGKILLFSFLGFRTHAVGVADTKIINVTLTEQISGIDEVVVIGYGTQKKSSVTSAVSKLENKNLDEIPTSRLDNALIGKIAGLTVQNNSSEVGSEPTIRIRGASSINANADPLVVVDGHPIADGLSFINPYDVESIEVLKDAASAAIYGSRGANGVILVTTKRGITDKPKYSVKSYYGIKEAYKVYPILSTTEYTELLFREAKLRENDPSVPSGSTNLINNNERAAYIIENQISGVSTDWQEEALRNAGIYNLQLNVAGGKKDMRYYVSGNLQQDQGVMKYSENNKGNFRVKFDANLSPKLALNVNLNPTYTKIQRPAENFTNYYRFPSFLPAYHSAFTVAFVNQNSQWADINEGDWAQARHFTNLAYAGTMPDGSFWSSTGNVSPFSSQNNTPISHAAREDRFSTSFRFQGGTDLTYSYSKALVFKTSLGAYYNAREDKNLIRSEAKKDGDVNSGIMTNGKNLDILWENTMNYTKSFGKHNFKALLGFTAQSTTVDQSRMVGYNSPSDDFTTLNQAAYLDQSQSFTSTVKTGLLSYLGRINYDYLNKYLLSASLRTDESSIFGVGNRRGWFPSVSAGWNVSSESFMEDTRSWLENLKLRASYGETGNNRIEEFSYLDLLFKSNYVFGEGTGQVNLGQSPNNPITYGPNITWETSRSANFGVDLGFFRNKIQLSVEYYRTVTDKLLLQQATQAITGSDSYWNNNGKIRNHGLEFEFTSANLKSKNVEWTTSVNFAANRNKLVKLGGDEPYLYNYGERGEIYASIVGKPYVQFLGYQTDGVWLSQDEVDAALATGQTSILQSYFQPGGLKIKDINGDNKIDVDDRTIIGSPFPDFTWGITNSVRYKNFDLSVLMQGSQGGDLINGDLYYNESKRQNKNYIKNRWLSPANPGDGKTPYFTNGIAADLLLTDYAVEDASYAYLRNVILGYTIKSKALKKLNVNSLRLYAAADNVFFITGKTYRGINPEARITSSAYDSPVIIGYQRGGFPVNRTFTFGVDFSF